MTTSEAERSAMRRALALAVTPGVPLGPNPRVGCVLLAPDGTTIAEGFHRGAGGPHAEVEALREAGDAARGADRRRHPRAVQPHRPHRALLEALVAAGVRRVVFAQPDTNPVAVGGADRLREAGIEVGGRAARRGRPGRQPRLDLRRRARPPVRHLEVRHHPRRAQRRRRRHQPLGLQPRRPPRHPPAARAVRHDARRHQHRRGRRPRAHRPRRGRRARGAPAAARGDGPARPRTATAGSSTTAPRRVHLRTRDPREALDTALRRGTASTSSSRAVRRWPGPSSRPGSSTRSSPTSRRCCSAPAPAPSPTSASPPSPTPSTCTSRDVHRAAGPRRRGHQRPPHHDPA